jgi:hypothetical protein
MKSSRLKLALILSLSLSLQACYKAGSEPKFRSGNGVPTPNMEDSELNDVYLDVTTLKLYKCNGSGGWDPLVTLSGSTNDTSLQSSIAATDARVTTLSGSLSTTQLNVGAVTGSVSSIQSNMTSMLSTLGTAIANSQPILLNGTQTKATTAYTANQANTLVARDATGAFSAGAVSVASLSSGGALSAATATLSGALSALSVSAANFIGSLLGNASTASVATTISTVLPPILGGTGTSSNSGTLTYGANNLTFTTLGSTNLTLPVGGTVATVPGAGIVKSNGNTLLASDYVNLSSEVSGILPASMGGTGATNLSGFVRTTGDHSMAGRLTNNRQVVFAAYDAGTQNTTPYVIDWDNGQNQTISISTCGQFQFRNMMSGGSYSLAVTITSATAGTCTFSTGTGSTNSTLNDTNFLAVPDKSVTGTKTNVFSFLVFGNNVYMTNAGPY